MSLAYSDKKFEKSNQRKALVITLAINALLFLLIWQVKIWNDSPNPPAIPVENAGIGEISFEQEAPAPPPAPQKEDFTIVEPIMSLEAVSDWADRVRHYT